MTNKKNIASKLVLALFILTLISCCLLGSTFARYASGGSGTASVGVAKWDVTITNSASTSFEEVKLSPSKGEWNGTTARTHSTGKKLVATITNKSDVAAKVTVTASDLGITLNDSCYFDENGYVMNGGSGVTGTGASAGQVKALFSLKLYQDTSSTYGSGAEITGETEITLNAGATDTVYIFAEVTWTSTDVGYSAALADTIDTWAGENVKSVGCTISYSAVQDSTLPA